MSSIGFWSPRGRSLVAVAVDDDGHASPPMRAIHTDEGCLALLAYFEATDGLDFELVTPEWLARGTPIAHFALERGVTVWLAPNPLIAAMREVGRLNTGPPHRTAAVIARLPLVDLFRGHLRRLAPGDQRQLRLW